MLYSAVLFDAAETLFTTRGSVGEIYRSVAVKFGSTASSGQIQHAFDRQFQRSGPLTRENEHDWWKDVVYRVFDDVGMVDNFDRLFDEIYELFRDSRGWILFPETQRVLEEFRCHNLKLGVISNFDSRLYTVLEDLKILGLFDSVTICSEVGFAKPQPEIFLSAIRALGVPPSRILFTGDSLLDDFLAGKGAGMETYLLDRSGRYGAMSSVRTISNLRDLLSVAGIPSKQLT